MSIKSFNVMEEKIFNKQLDNGLSVTIIQKKGFKTVSAAFTTSFGGIYNKISVNGTKYDLPLGVAHFLEHKLFASENGEDITIAFSNIGLEVNAYTDYYNTTYYFNGSKNIHQGIELLLDFVQSPHFTDENVESEKGIIEQELLMYQDIPSEAASLGLMNNMYHTFPYIYDVGGTVEDVYKINKEILYFCYELFYHPKNMQFVIVGDVDVDEIFEIIENNQNKKVFKDFQSPQIIIDKECDTIAKDNNFSKMDVVNPKVLIGLKLPMRKNIIKRNELPLDDLYYRIIKNTLFGGYTKFYQKLLDDKIICGRLRSGYNGDNYAQYLSIGADVHNVDEFIKRIKKRLKTLKNIKFSQKEIDRVKKDAIGKYILSFNNVEAIMGDYLDSVLRNYDYLNFIEIVNSLDINTLYQKSIELLNAPLSIYIIFPND